MPEWITDCLPTAADADECGFVQIPCTVDAKPLSVWVTRQHWTLIRHGAKWFPISPTRHQPPEGLLTGQDAFYVLVTASDMPGGGNQAIVSEHEFPQSTTLESVLERQKRIGLKYGNSWIAECRIKPETALLSDA